MLKVDNLTFEVNEEGRKRCLVNHISFEVKDGEMLVITGPNGGGKSTLAKVLAGIEDANGGEIFLDEENITGYDIDHRANAGKDDCKGICSRCGANLNIQTCDCDTTGLDPRMAAIKDIFSKFKEV